MKTLTEFIKGDINESLKYKLPNLASLRDAERNVGFNAKNFNIFFDASASMSSEADMYQAIADGYPRIRTKIFNFDAEGVHDGLPRNFSAGSYIGNLLKEVARRSDSSTLNIIYTDGDLSADPRKTDNVSIELRELRNIDGYVIFTTIFDNENYLNSQISKYDNATTAIISMDY